MLYSFNCEVKIVIVTFISKHPEVKKDPKENILPCFSVLIRHYLFQHIIPGNVPSFSLHYSFDICIMVFSQLLFILDLDGKF